MENGIIPTPAKYIKDFEQLAFGMFVHFGLYSQLNAGEWTFHIHGRDMEEYKLLADTFNVKTMFDIVNLAKSAGCRYVCLTTRHHEGFSLYDTCGLNDFDALHTPSGRDLVCEFVDMCREAGLVPFFYHTTLDWYNPDFKDDFDKYLDYLYDSVEILCTRYGKIGGIWFDGNWSKPNADWKEDRLYAMIRRHQPEAMIINNTGLGARGALGADEIDAVTFEQGMPTAPDRRGWRKYVAGEMCETINSHWGAADDLGYKPVSQLIREICNCRKVGANMLLNVGPSGDGSVSKMQEATMELIGRWMNVYGKAIYNGRPYLSYEGKSDFILRDEHDDKIFYLFSMNPGQSSGDENVSVELGGEKATVFKGFEYDVSSVRWIDNGEDATYEKREEGLLVSLKGFPYGQNLCVRVAEIKTK